MPWTMSKSYDVLITNNDLALQLVLIDNPEGAGKSIACSMSANVEDAAGHVSTVTAEVLDTSVLTEQEVTTFRALLVKVRNAALVEMGAAET